jgi:hypothetical protein
LPVTFLILMSEFFFFIFFCAKMHPNVPLLLVVWG